MIDIHSHILPDVDDGAKDLDEAVTMLRISADYGVKTQVLTPHIHIGRYDNNIDSLNTAFQQFQKAVSNTGINIELKLAAEVRINERILELAIQNKLPTIGTYKQKKVFLLEFPRNEIPYGSDNLVKWLISKDYLPLIVHPERNSTFLNHREKLETFLDLGCPIQVTACSLLGKFGDDVQEMSQELIAQNLVFAMASDCHNLKGRKPDLKEGFEFVKEKFGELMAFQLTRTNPCKLIVT